MEKQTKLLKTMRILFLILFMLFKGSSYGQTIANRQSSTGNRAERSFSRLVFSPSLIPHYSLATSFTDGKGNRILLDNEFGVRSGLRWENYRPNSKKAFALEGDFFLQEFIFQSSGRFFYSDRSIGITPIFSIGTNSLEKVRHGFIELGLHQRFSFKRELVYIGENDERRYLPGNNLKLFRAWTYIGAGLRSDLFDHDWSRVRLGVFRIGAYLPLFDQANLFRNRDWSFVPLLEPFEQSYYWSIMPVVSYSQMINMDKRADGYSVPNKYLPNTGRGIFGPAPDWRKIQRGLTGNFYGHFLLQQAVDSITIEQNADRYLISLDPSWGWRAGYTLHFFGNNRRFYNRKKQIGVVDLSGEGFRWNVFAGVGIMTTHLRSQQDFFTRYHLQLVENQIGVRMGFGSIFVHAGYSRHHYLENEVFIGNQALSEFLYGKRTNDAWFFGLSLNNSVVLRAYYQDTYPLREDRRFTDNLFFSFGFGL